MHDAHNHLQDPRLDPYREQIITEMHRAGIKRCVVNGTSPADWETVHSLAKSHPDFIIPSFGLHPWKEPTDGWQEKLNHFLDLTPHAGVGECGLDRWIDGHDIALQSEIFLTQLSIATERNLPLTIHCLRAWGPLIDLLESHPMPERGFLLHSYGGSAELVPKLVKLGAYFSFSGYFLHERKRKVRTAFQSMPPERILLETDAPDMLPPEAHNNFPLDNSLNHPANLKNIYQAANDIFSTSMVDENFARFFSVS